MATALEEMSSALRRRQVATNAARRLHRGALRTWAHQVLGSCARGTLFCDHYARDLGMAPVQARAECDADMVTTDADDAWSAAFDRDVPDIHAWILAMVQFGHGPSAGASGDACSFPQLAAPPP